MTESKTKVLLLEPQRNLCMAAMFALESRFNFHVIDCHTIGVAERMLEINEDIKAILFCGAVGGESTENFYMSNKERFASIPIICTNEESCSHWPVVPNLKFPKTELVSGVLDAVEELFEVNEDAPVEKYTPVTLKTLSFADALSDDAYVKLRSGRLIKLFSIGDKIDEGDVARYQRKGVDKLYLDRKACMWILKVINANIDRMIEDENFSVDLIDSEIIDDSRDARELFGEMGDEEYVENVFQQEEEFIEEIHQQTTTVINNIKHNKDLMKMLSKIKFDKGEGAFVKNRMKLASALSCAIARAMGWDSEQTFEKLIYCAHIHDIMLVDSPNLAKFRYLTEADAALDMGKITESDRERFYKHTIHAAELIKLDHGAPPDAVTIVQQHHEMPSGDGFPSKMSGIRINAFAAILSVSIDLSQYLLMNKEKNFARYIEDNKARYKGGNFTKVIRAIAELTGTKY